MTYKNLLVGIASRDGPRALQESVAQRTLAMVDMRNDAEVAVSLDRDRSNAGLELGGRRFRREGASAYRGGEDP